MTLIIKVEQLERELRGIIDKALYEMLKEMNMYEHLEQFVRKHVDKIVDKRIDSRVYKYLEESEIEVPSEYRYGSRGTNKITLNDYIVKVAHDTIVSRVMKKLNDLDIVITKKEND